MYTQSNIHTYTLNINSVVAICSGDFGGAMRLPIPTIKLHFHAMRQEEGAGEACVREVGVAAVKGLIEG
jgi:hypothetical protein